MSLPPQITFEEESSIRRKRAYVAPQSRFVAFVIRISGGYIKNSIQANVVLLLCIAICLVATVRILSGGNSSDRYPEELKILPAV